MEPATAAVAAACGQVAPNAPAPPARRAPRRPRERATGRGRVVSLQARRARHTPAREQLAPPNAAQTSTATKVPPCTQWLPTVAEAPACSGKWEHAHRPYSVQPEATATLGIKSAQELPASVRRAVHTAASPTTGTHAPAPESAGTTSGDQCQNTYRTDGVCCGGRQLHEARQHVIDLLQLDEWYSQQPVRRPMPDLQLHRRQLTSRLVCP
jgi:hypothetical protein